MWFFECIEEHRHKCDVYADRTLLFDLLSAAHMYGEPLELISSV